METARQPVTSVLDDHMSRACASRDQPSDDDRIDALRDDDIGLRACKPQRPAQSRDVGPAAHAGTRRRDARCSDLVEEVAAALEREEAWFDPARGQSWQKRRPLPLRAAAPECRRDEQDLQRSNSP
jgi:hypothetical protein